MLNQETKRKIDSCRDILVGKLPDPKAQIEQITYALIYKFMGDMDKSSVALGGKASFFVNGYEQYAWDKLMSTNIGGKQRLDLYSEAIAKLSLNPYLPQLFRDIFKDAFLPYRDPETLNMFLKEINWFTYSHSEDLGDAFEYLLSVMSSQGDAGQFRTPRHIIDFIVEAVDPKKDETILDPACGTAGFLISSYKHILKQNTGENPGDKLTSDEKQDLMNQIVGYDISPDMVRLSLVNMYLHGFPEPHIYEYDTLTDEGRWEDNFDVIMANPPFMSPKGGIRPHKRFSVQANRSEVLFVDYIAEHLTASGRAGVIVPEGIIFQSGNAYKALRKMLVENYLFCVVSLPAGVFNPYSGVKTSILLMDKKLSKKTDRILFIKIENDGLDLGAQRREIQGSDLPQALNDIKNYIQSVLNGKEFNTAGTTNLLPVTKKQLGENGDYNLSMERYKTEEIRKTQWPMVELGGICTINPKKSTLNGIDKNVQVSFVPMSDLNENEICFTPKEKRLLNDVYGSYTYFQDNDVLIARVTPCFENGKSGIALNLLNGIGFGSSEFTVLRAKNTVLPKWLYYHVATERFRLFAKAKMTGTGGLQRVPTEIFSIYQIPFPPLNIQQEIVAEIETYQKIIDGARQVVENYKPQIKIDSEWEVIDLKELVEIRTGKIDVNKAVKNGIYPFFTCAKELYYIDDFTFDCEALLLAGNNATGVFDVKHYKGKFNAYQRTYVITISDDKVNSIIYPYLKYIMENNLELLKRNSIGSQTRYLTLGMIQQLKIPLPTIEFQKLIAVQLEKEQQLVAANKELIQIYEQKIKDKIAEVWET